VEAISRKLWRMVQGLVGHSRGVPRLGFPRGKARPRSRDRRTAPHRENGRGSKGNVAGEASLLVRAQLIVEKPGFRK